ncbi:MAG: class I adenylate-forming enzyme family protein [Spirochaetaceae bacterium]
MKSLNELIRTTIADWPNSVPVVVDTGSGQHYFPGILTRKIDELSVFLERVGIEAGDRLLLFLPNSPAFLVLLFAARRLGAVVAPVKTDWKRAEISVVLRDLNPKAIVTEGGFESLFPASVPVVLLLDPDKAELSLLAARDNDGSDRANGYFAPEYADGVPEAAEASELSGDVASINFTYRGLGYPLGAMVPDQQYIEGAEIFSQGMAGRISRRMLVFLPMAHIFTLVGCVFAPLLSGMTTYYSKTLLPSRVMETIGDYDIDFITTVPEVLSLLRRYAERHHPIEGLDIIATGGSVLSPEEYEAARDVFHCEVLHGYGLTEMTPISRNIRGSSRAGTVGPVAREIQLRVDEGTSEIQIKGRNIFRGYFRRPEETKSAFSEDGWFLTGDAGAISDGHLVFEGEIKQTRKVNGALVDLNEVARVIRRVPAVRDVELVYEDSRIKAGVDFYDAGGTDRQRTLRRVLNQDLAAYKIPHIFQK